MKEQYYIAHSGILGMKWGKRNGPPYPLDYNKLSPEEKAKDKERAIREGDVQTASKNRNHYTDQELNAVATRFELNKKISNLERSTIVTGADRVKKFCNTVQDLSTYGNKIINGYSTVKRACKELGLTAPDQPKATWNTTETTIIKDGKPQTTVTQVKSYKGKYKGKVDKEDD